MRALNWGRVALAATVLCLVCTIVVMALLDPSNTSWWDVAYAVAGPLVVGYLVYRAARVIRRLFEAAVVAPLTWLLQPGGYGVHGTARWRSRSQVIRGTLCRQGGIFLGGWRSWRWGQLYPLTVNGQDHCLVIGSSRSGKGTGIIVPTLLNWPNSLLAYDEKGELFRLSSGFREREAGNRVLRFEPADPHCGARFNFLSAVRVGTEYEVGDSMNIAAVLTVDEEQVIGDQHWRDLAAELIAGVILFCLHRGGALFPACLGDVLDTLGQSDLYDAMTASTNRFVRGVGAAAAARSERERSSILSAARRYLRLFADPVIAANTRTCDFTLADLADAERPASLYIITRGIDAIRLKPLVRLLFEVAMTSLMSVPLEFDGDGQQLPAHKWPVLLCLDEFASLGPMRIIESSLARCLGYCVSSLIVTQDIAQLEKNYGRNQTVSVNCNLRIVFPPNEHATADWASKHLGQMTVSTEMTSSSESRSRSQSDQGGSTGSSSSVSNSVQHTARALLLADEILTLPKPTRTADGRIASPGKMLVIEAGQRAILGEQLLYWQDPELDRRSKLPPAEGTLATRQQPRLIPFPMPQPRLPAPIKVAASIAGVMLISGFAWWGAASVPRKTTAMPPIVHEAAGVASTAAGMLGVAAAPVAPQPQPAPPFGGFAPKHEVTASFKAANGQPMVGATVQVFAPGHLPAGTGRTDADGKYVFETDGRSGFWSAEAKSADGQIARVMVNQ